MIALSSVRREKHIRFRIREHGRRKTITQQIGTHQIHETSYALAASRQQRSVGQDPSRL